jgi:outer membrane receptor protein involved in Fe transport
VRAEHTDIFTDADLFHEQGYGINDIRRENVGGFALVNPGVINQWDILPSGSLIYKIKSKKETQGNLRFNYSQSVARPSIREMSDAAIYDNEFRTLIYGNSDLKLANITNYDFRGEVYFASGDNVSASVFYKDFKNHIEMGFGSAGITWDNIAQSTVRGIELEGKKQIGNNLEFRANLTLVKSEAEFVRKDLQIIDGKKVYTIIDTLYRPMFGQAPYLFNSILSYTADSLGLTATVSYNVQGPRLVIAGAVKGRPDVYEIPRHLVDFKVSKTIGEHYIASLTVRDILNSPVRRAYDLPRGYVDYDNFRYGTNFLVSFAYKL